MKNRMSVARCCCVCEDCCNGAVPTEFDLDLTIGDEDCGNCDTTLSGAYTLTQGVVPCGWHYTRSWSPNTEICAADPYNPWWLLTQYIQIRVRCADATHYWVDAWMTVGGSAYFTIPNPFPWLPGFTMRSTIYNRWWWSEKVLVTDWSCDGVVNWCLPYAFGHWAWQENGPWHEFDSTYPQFCDATSSTFCLTAVP